jgi:hypothetical protein
MHADGNREHTVVDIGQAPDGTVTVETRFPDGGRGWLGMLGLRQPCRVDYTVRVPAACAVELSLVESEAYVQGLAGDFSFHTVSGSVRLADLTGSLRVHTVSGNVAGERIVATGPVHLSTVSGAVTLLASHLPAVTATTVSGGLNLETRLGPGPYVFTSVSGDIRLRVPAATRCSLSLHTQSGRVHSNVASSRARASGDALSPSVRLHSVSGDLWLVAADDAEESPAPATSAAPDRRDVLERIARGELSVEDGVATLRAY